MIARLFLGLLGWGSRIVVMAGLLALVARLTIRDQWPLYAPLYYATPWPVLALVFWPEIVRRLVLRRGYWVPAGLALLSAGCLLAWPLYSFRLRGEEVPVGPEAQEAAETELTLMLWNVAGFSRAPYTEFTPYLRGELAIWIEAPLFFPEEQMRRLEHRLPGYRLFRPGDGILVFHRGEVQEHVRRVLTATGGVAHYIRLGLPGGTSLICLICDLASSPLHSRREALASLASFARESIALTDAPAILCGDFNTPGESALLDPLREIGVRAHDLGGRGWRETWPEPFPLLDLDQIWTLRGAGVRSAWREPPPALENAGALSDHWIRHGWFTLEGKRGPPPALAPR